jgi:parallel beta-helix repeat protein
MPRKIIFKVVALILLAVAIRMKCNTVVLANPSTILVPSQYYTIQKAINAANPGDVIKVTHGTYCENLNVNKSVSIIGEDPKNTIIDGGGNGNVINVLKPNVKISGFTIQNGKIWPYCGISNSRCNYTVINNTILRNNYYGLQLTKSNNSRIFNNLILNNSYAGMYIHESSSANVFFENTIKDNFIGLWSQNSQSNIFYHNNFVNNTNQALIDISMIWDNGEEGNYWSDYEGIDVDLNGIGDSEYPIAGDKDKYPLMGAFANFTFLYDSEEYSLPTICNSTISNFQFDKLHEKISFDILGPNATIGFCRITIPTVLIQRKCIILVDDRVPIIRNWTASTYGYRYFLYGNTGLVRKITIEFELPGKGTPPSLLIPILIVSSVVIVVLILTIFKKGKWERKFKVSKSRV